jgi:hypothetical protein
MFSSSERAARVGSIPIARSNFCCLACPCVVLGRDLAYRPVLVSGFADVSTLRGRLADGVNGAIGT